VAWHIGKESDPVEVVEAEAYRLLSYSGDYRDPSQDHVWVDVPIRSSGTSPSARMEADIGENLGDEAVDADVDEGEGEGEHMSDRELDPSQISNDWYSLLPSPSSQVESRLVPSKGFADSDYPLHRK